MSSIRTRNDFNGSMNNEDLSHNRLSSMENLKKQLRGNNYCPPHMRSNIPFATDNDYTPQKVTKRNSNLNRSCGEIENSSKTYYVETKSSVKPLSTSSNLNHFSLMNEKLKQRENFSQLASKKISQLQPKEKDVLQMKNEKADFMLNKGLMEEKMRRVKAQAKEKEDLQKEHLHKYVKQDKTEVSNYYRNYVENPEVRSGIHKLGTKTSEKTKIMYAQELIEQSNMRKIKQDKTKMKEEKEKIKEITYSKIKHDMNQLEKMDRDSKMREEFKYMNSSLLENKKRSTELKKQKEINKEREWLGKIDQDLQYERDLVNQYKNQMKNHFKENLNKQVQEKQRIRSLSQQNFDN